MSEDILLSVICATYNHENYIEKAIRGIFSQQTCFEYEVLVGEDCSTDNSRGVLKILEKEFPKMQVFYRETNYGVIRNFQDLTSRARGKYIIILETDDFWISPFKLQKQVDFLENNTSYIAVAHKCLMVGKNGELLNKKYPESDHEEYTLDDFYKRKLAGQTTTLMYRNYHTYDLGFDCSIVKDSRYEYGPGDMKKNFMLASVGKVACMQEIMSAYRFVEDVGSSYTAQQKKNKIDYIKLRKNFVDYAHESNISKKAVYIAELMYAETLMKYAFRKKNEVTLKFAISEIDQLICKNRCYLVSIWHSISVPIRKIFRESNTYRSLNKKEMIEARSVYNLIS